MYVYYNGRFLRSEELSIPLTDRALYFGDGVYEVLLGRKGVPYQFDEHFERLKKSCEALYLSLPLSRRDLLASIYKLCDISRLDNFMLYLQISRNGETRTHDFREGEKSNILIFLTEFSSYSHTALKAITVRDMRYEMCNVKTLNLLPSVLAIHEAKRRGCDSAIFVRNGYVTEEARSNVFIIKSDELVTSPLSKQILPGITRDNVIKAAKALHIPVTEREFSEEELMGADEVFLSSTTKFIKRVEFINDSPTKKSNGDLFFNIRSYLLHEFMHKTDG